MRPEGADAREAQPGWRQTAVLSLVKWSPVVIGVGAVSATADDDATGLAAIVVVAIVAVALGQWLARVAAKRLSVTRTELSGRGQAAEILALAALAAVVLLALDALPVPAKLLVLLAGSAAVEATAAATATGTARSPTTSD